MKAILTEPAASTLIVLDEVERATLTEIARTTGKPLSTIQRAVDALVDANILEREAPRGRIRFASDAPRRPLRQLAEWCLGLDQASRIAASVGDNVGAAWSDRVPSSVHQPVIRTALPQALRSIVAEYGPVKVVLFGSQARGDATSQSDVDLLVVFAGAVDRRNRRVEILRLLRDMPFAKDVLVATTTDVAQPLIGSALADAVREGVTVYER